MRRTVLATLLLGGMTTMAAAQATSGQATTEVVRDADTGQIRTIVYDKELTKEFEINRQIVDRVQAAFGETAVYDNGQDLPAGLDDALEPGNKLPEDIDTKEPPAELGDLPTLGTGTHWVAAGEHLVEVTPDNTIVMVVYDALP
jgi:hypothetical protein